MMSPKEEILQILADPQDGDVITLYQALYCGDRMNVVEKTYAYHKNTPWDEFSPDDPGGADIVDMWMTTERGHVIGRAQTKRIIENIRSRDQYRLFVTRGEALTYAIEATARRVKELKRRLATEHAAIAELKEEKVRLLEKNIKHTQELADLQEEDGDP